MSLKVTDINKQNVFGKTMSREPARAEKDFGSSFEVRLKQLKGSTVPEKLTNLLADIDQQADKFNEKLYLGDLIQYKKLVQNFLDVAVRNTYQFSKESFLDRRGRHRVFSIVKEVNRELESLTKDFLNNEKDNIRILKKVDDIRGLLIDTFM
ncbi:YaaR family protein [Anaerosolibacter sp.]|uniref:YaaR family protein n=1 Tax=Anaerosolibacter sp. TaxID=1872527 RepID=UPI0039EE0779